MFIAVRVQILILNVCGLQRFEVGDDLGSVSFGVDTMVFFNNLAAWVDDERVALGIHILAAHEFFGLPAVVGFNCFVVWIAQECEVEMMFVDKFLVAGHAIFAHTHHFGVAEVGNGVTLVTKRASFGGATRRVVLWVKIQHQPSASIVAKRMRFTILVW